MKPINLKKKKKMNKSRCSNDSAFASSIKFHRQRRNFADKQLSELKPFQSDLHRLENKQPSWVFEHDILVYAVYQVSASLKRKQTPRPDSERLLAYHRRAILMGVVRQEVKRSAGRSGFMGSSSLASQAASWMQFFMDGGRGIWARGWLGLIAAT